MELQEINSKRSRRRRQKPVKESTTENFKCSANANDTAIANMVTPDHSTGGNSSEMPENPNSRRKHNKSSSKQQFIHKQRLFPANSRPHGSPRNSVGLISESPPSDAVGFFFGSTPPDSQGRVPFHFF